MKLCGDLKGQYGCKNEASKEPHICPYQADINNNEETLCYCCTDCEHECAMDI